MPLASMQESLRSAAQLVFSWNQSRSKVLSDPLYELAAWAMLRGELPLDERLRRQSFPDDLYDQVEYLLGTRLESTFDAYFRMFAPDCERCGLASFRCACEELEPHPRATA